MMLGKYFKKTVFRKEHTADGVMLVRGLFLRRM